MCELCQKSTYIEPIKILDLHHQIRSILAKTSKWLSKRDGNGTVTFTQMKVSQCCCWTYAGFR